ncbi:MAG TPA: alpha/beta fold hydrolase [Cytophagaceae bacterium]|jgi:predicted alpha/beta-fold hydrolase|nr:alpha/beta fold hydrolase [Cytophagaceae bacterium]
MPIISSNYKAPKLFISRHIETIYPVAFRNVSDFNYDRERFELNDGDFLDLDWIRKNNKKLLILSHGLEGQTESKYLKGMARAASNVGYDVLAWNYRGCSEEINRNFRFYHSGESADLDLIVQYALSKNTYTSIGLVGFSIGGNITLKYLGEKSNSLSPLIKAAVTFSAPCNLNAAAIHMARFGNKFYMNRFLDNLHAKILAKAGQYPDRINDKGFDKIKNFIDFDERYTAPLHGFKNAMDYYKKCSSVFFIPEIKIPTLLVSALNDPFLAKACYPFEQARNNSFFFIETPKQGGHCGFYENNKNGNYWSDNRALDFFSKIL